MHIKNIWTKTAQQQGIITKTYLEKGMYKPGSLTGTCEAKTFVSIGVGIVCL